MNKTIFSDVLLLLYVNGSLKTCCYRSQGLIKKWKRWSSDTSREVLLQRAGGSASRAARWVRGFRPDSLSLQRLCTAASDAPLLHLLHSMCPPHLCASPCSSQVSSRLCWVMVRERVLPHYGLLWNLLFKLQNRTTEQFHESFFVICVFFLHNFKRGQIT